MLKPVFVRACLNTGISVGLNAGISFGKQTDMARVLNLISRLHPIDTEHSLIRLGSDNDGGYLIPDDFEGIVACFSPGVEINASFENDMLKRGIGCYLADGSVDGAPIQGVHFLKKFI